ncbi:MAG: putative peptidyl-prolyl cis-trans isomerase cyclophilin type [Frankiales bacterium]|nr:putative peptidyl-prolyl cis-trans isomerase cyclophilin type [Frankiales bacterium]
MASSRREKELARQRAERQAARRAAAAAKRKQRNAVLATVLAVVLVVVGIGVAAASLSRGGSSDPAASASSSASPKPGECRYEQAGTAARKVALPPTEGVETKGIYRTTMTTNRGTIAFKMDAGLAPCTVNSMRSLAHFGFFDKTPCWRLTAQSVFVLQCGDPTGVGTGGPGYRFADENTEGAVYKRGTVAMANNGPGTGTNGSQFFLVYKDSQLPPGYTVFGQITSGLDVLDKVAAAGSTPAGDGRPKLPVDVATVRIAEVA